MTPADYQLEIYRGDSAHWRFKLWAASGVPTDLTGVTSKVEIRDRPGGKQIALLNCAVTLPNVVDVTLSSVASRSLPPKGVWDLQITYPSTEVQTPIGGAVIVTPDVTDST